MNYKKNYPLFFFLIITVTFVFASLQSILWPQIVGSVSSPILWLNVLVYQILYKKFKEAIFTNYLIGLILSSYTSMNLGYLWGLILFISSLAAFIKGRVFWPGVRYYLLFCTGASIVYHIFLYSMSQILEINAVDLNLISRTTEILLTAVSAAPIYWLMTWFDRICEKEEAPSRGELAT